MKAVFLTLIAAFSCTSIIIPSDTSNNVAGGGAAAGNTVPIDAELRAAQEEINALRSRVHRSDKILAEYGAIQGSHRELTVIHESLKRSYFLHVESAEAEIKKLKRYIESAKEEIKDLKQLNSRNTTIIEDLEKWHNKIRTQLIMEQNAARQADNTSRIYAAEIAKLRASLERTTATRAADIARLRATFERTAATQAAEIARLRAERAVLDTERLQREEGNL